MNFGEKPRRRISLNITSLVDILIVLLLFFMLTTQFMHMEILNLNLAGGDKENSNATVNSGISIILPGAGKFILNGNEFSLLQLKEKLSPLIKNNPEKDIILLSRNKSSVQDVVTAIDYLKTIGGKNISIAEDK